MRGLLQKYIRSLGEQEQAGDGPERYQDLGTFVCWLLERSGYRIHMRSYRHQGALRKKSTGYRQWGVDILASKPDEDGVERAWRFVLKQGDFGRAQLVSSEPGSMFADLEEAAHRYPSDDRRHEPDRFADWERVTVVAVHNGDVNTNEIGAQVETKLKALGDRAGMDVAWWHADKLVELALQPPVEAARRALDAQADASLFPPAVGAFARLALDSLARDGQELGRSFDVAAVDLLIERTLPLGREHAQASPGARPSAGRPMRADRVYRAGSELALFAGMLEVECRRIARGNTLPVLDTIARILCRLVEHLRRLERSALQGYKRKLASLLRDLVDRYMQQARCLRQHLAPLLDVPYGLALPGAGHGERIDYPLRTLRLAGHLAIAGLGCLDRGDEAGARDFADALARLARSNDGGMLSPITDDQIIELASIWMLWLRLGIREPVGQTARRLLDRLGWRNLMGLPLPALWMRASMPMVPADLRTLVDAHLGGRGPGSWLDDTGSTILPLAMTLCRRAGMPVDDALLDRFRPARARAPGGSGRARDEPPVRVVYAQSWQPPEDAGDEWYAWEIRRRGTTHVYDLTEDAAAIVAAFETFHDAPAPASPAAAWGLPVIDWMAWATWRTPPPMRLFLETRLW